MDQTPAAASSGNAGHSPNALQFPDQYTGQPLQMAPRFISFRRCCKMKDHLAHHRADGERAAYVWRHRQAWLDKQAAEPRVGCGQVTVRCAARDPDAAIRQRHPPCPGNLAGHGSPDGKDQLALAMLVDRDFFLNFLQLQPKRNRRQTPPVRIKAADRRSQGIVLASFRH